MDNIKGLRFTVPNILSCIRIALTVAFCITYFGENRMVPFVILIVSAVSDFLDGFIARTFGQTSELGKILDPAADKLFTVSTLACLCIGGKIPFWVIGVILFKELAMTVGGIVTFKKIKGVVASKWYGKLATLELFLAIAVTMLFDALGLETYATNLITNVLMYLGAALVLFAGVNYLVLAIRLYCQTGEEKGK